MRVLAVAALVAVGGCALTPVEVMEQGRRTDWASALTPQAASECVARNAENLSSALSATIRGSGAPWGLETVVRSRDSGVSSVTKAAPREGGSQLSTWVSPNVLTHDSYLAALKSGC